VVQLNLSQVPQEVDEWLCSQADEDRGNDHGDPPDPVDRELLVDKAANDPVDERGGDHVVPRALGCLDLQGHRQAGT